ncbi:MAG: endonuclease V [Verrucomicrobiota bacterium]|nr:endonuclease V [Verrucomicrobiota bacterium]
MTLRGKSDPGWSALVAEWKATQARLRERMVVAPLEPLPRFVAGADCAFSPDKRTIFAAAVVYDRETRRIVEVTHATRPAEIPYVPGFLSFREGPAIKQAIGALQHEFGAILFDGHGFAHPRRCGIASHLAIELDKPGVGVGKSRFIGAHGMPASRAGATTPLCDGGEQIGAVLRTQAGIRPVFVSIGHRVDLTSAVRLVLACCTRYRIPEPTRQADIEVAKLKRDQGRTGILSPSDL